MITAINANGETRKVSAENLSWSSYSKVIPFYLWKKVPGESWVVCPRYGKHPYSVQIGMTGTCWKNESQEEALAREIQEETGLVLTEDPYLHRNVRGRAPKKQSWLWAVCNAKTKCRAAIGAVRMRSSKRLDDKSRKIGAIIYSDRLKLLQSMIVNSALRGGLCHIREDDIVELLLVPTNLAKKIASYPSQNQ